MRHPNQAAFVQARTTISTFTWLLLSSVVATVHTPQNNRQTWLLERIEVVIVVLRGKTARGSAT